MEHPHLYKLNIPHIMPIFRPQNSKNEPKACSKSLKTCSKRVDKTTIYTSQQTLNQKDKAKTCRCVDNNK